MAIKNGWRTVEREIEGAILDTVVDEATGLGLKIVSRDIGHVVLNRDGSHLAIRSKSAPLEVSLTESERGVRARFRYQTLAAFDTGDLDRMADEITADLTANT